MRLLLQGTLASLKMIKADKQMWTVFIGAVVAATTVGQQLLPLTSTSCS